MDASGMKLSGQPVQDGAPKRAIRLSNEQAIMRAAEEVFAQLGFKGATTDAIARCAGVPKSNLHYYFSTKAALYRRVIENVCDSWLGAAQALDHNDDPARALGAYIDVKMDQARSRPYGSRLWAMEVLRGAPEIESYLHETLKGWFDDHVDVLDRWAAAGKMDPVDPQTLFFMIWATTQHYADFASQIAVLNGDKPLSDAQFLRAKEQVRQIILKGVGLKS